MLWTSTQVALYPLSSPNHNLLLRLLNSMFVALYPLSSPNHNNSASIALPVLLRYILFHHQTTTRALSVVWCASCVISSFITKPQPKVERLQTRCRCVISSFITKPQRSGRGWNVQSVALYPLSSPNHNSAGVRSLWFCVALYPLSSPNHNQFCASQLIQRLRYILFHHQTTTASPVSCVLRRLRYILFHHQTTTGFLMSAEVEGCVISSFITKPQRELNQKQVEIGCVISSFITKPQLAFYINAGLEVALYPLSSPNHNTAIETLSANEVALYPLSSPNHNLYFLCIVI